MKGLINRVNENSQFGLQGKRFGRMVQNSKSQKIHKKSRGQTMVEFALAFPVFLMLVLGIIEFGRLLVAYSSVYVAAREAARYGAAVEEIATDVPRYQDCQGMRNAAARVGFLGFLDNPFSQVAITYVGKSSLTSKADCNATPSGFNPALGDRVRVVVTVTYQPIIGIIPQMQISSTAIRTIISKISIDQRR